MTSSIGFETLKQKANEVTYALRDIARLIDSKDKIPQNVELHSGGLIIPGLNMPIEARNLRSQADAIDEGMFTIIVLGTFKNGKSTLLNAMIGEQQLPAGAAPTTGVITMLVYGNRNVVSVYEYEKEEPRLLTIEEFYDEYRLKTEDADELREFRFQNVRYARIECLHPVCAKGVRLVDSPGLGEHTSRSELSTNFLKQSQAIIFVLDAIHLLSKDEREYILKQLGNGVLDNVFFVINRVNMVEPEDIPDLKERARSLLKKHFVDNGGTLDEDFYNSRVFWVNALGALRARQARPTEIDRLTKSGISHFEDNLEIFLTAEQMFQIALKASLRVLLDTVRRANQYVQSEKIALGKPLDELERRRDTASQQLDELVKRLGYIENDIQRVAANVQLKLEISLNNFVDQMVADWENDAPALIEKMSEIRFVDVATAALRPDVKEKIAKVVTKVIKDYVEAKFESWSQQATELTRADVKQLEADLKEQIEDFVVKLSEARSEFTGDTSAIQREQSQIAINIATGIFVGGSGLLGIVAGTLRRLFLLLLVLSVSTLSIFGWALLIVLILAEIGIIGDKENTFKRRMLDKIAELVHNNLRDDLRSDDLNAASITNLPSLLEKLNQRTREIDRFIYKELTTESRNRVKDYHRGDKVVDEKDEEIAKLLVGDLNQILNRSSIYNETRFKDVSVADETERLLKSNPSGKDVPLLNRYLLIHAYPDLILPKIKDVINRTVQAQFAKVSQDLTGKLRAEIQQLRDQMDSTVNELRKETFSATQESQRLDQVKDKMLELVNVVSQAVYKRDCTLEELEAVAVE
jgi:GTPase SAR1 family protein